MPFRPKYADVAATVALVLSMGGTAYAATVIYSSNIADSTIQSRDVRDDNLLSRDVRNGTLTSADVLNGSLSGADVKDGSLGLADINDTAEQALKGQTGDQGPQGPQGLQGEPGEQGASGVSGYEDVVGSWVPGTVGDTLVARAACPSGKKPLSGGFESATGSMAFSTHYSHHVTLAPNWDVAYPDGAELWEVQGHAVYNGVPGAEWSLRAWVTCAYVS